jgi:hypothetical protein
MVEDNESLEPGGVEVDINEAEWFNEAMESAMIASEDEPSMEEALKGDERLPWSDAIEAELFQIEKLRTWDLVVPPPGANIIPSRYVFRRKRDDEGRIVRYKARLVAKGFKQQYGVDYTDTFAPTVRPATLRILLSLGAQKGSVIVQVDAKNAYLNARLEGDIELYMKLPPLYKSYRQLPPELEKEHEVVCKLLAPMYGTKQGAHDWYANVKRILLTLGYSVSNADEAVFYIFERDKYTIIATATDDFTIIADLTKSSDLIQNQFSQHFEIVDNGPHQENYMTFDF